MCRKLTASKGYKFFFFFEHLLCLCKWSRSQFASDPSPTYRIHAQLYKATSWLGLHSNKFEIDSLGFVFLNHLSNNKPRAGGGGPLSIQTRKNCFEKHTPQTQNRNTKNTKGNQMLQQKKRQKKKEIAPFSIKKTTWNFLNFGYKVLPPLFFFFF